MKVFLDTNILLDVLTKRKLHYEWSALVWTLAETGKIKGLVSVLSCTNIFYIVRKLKNRKTALGALKHIKNIFGMVTCNGHIISQAIDSGFKDFEDAVQYYSAIQADADCIISRNPGHFPDTVMPVLTPSEFIVTYSFE